MQPTDEDEAHVVNSPLSQRLIRHGVAVQVEIYGDGKGRWILEVIDSQDTSHVWDDPFDSDLLALEEAIRALEEETVEFLHVPANPTSSTMTH